MGGILLVGAIDLNRQGGSSSPRGITSLASRIDVDRTIPRDEPGGINRSGLEMIADSLIPRGEPSLPAKCWYGPAQRQLLTLFLSAEISVPIAQAQNNRS
jgi:hypothetical protein